jgi:tetratricopeptide (TPR) repeat protein
MFKSFLVCLLFLGSFNGALRAEDVPYFDFVKKFYDSINHNDFENIYKNMVTPRFHSSADFDSFQTTMQNINKDLGRVKVYRESYKFEDNRFNGLVFFRLQYQVKHEHRDSQERIVVMKGHGKFLIDGYAVYSNGKFEIAQGNLNWFDTMNILIALTNPELAKAWVTMKNQSVTKDSYNRENVNKLYRERYYGAILVAANGNFVAANQSLNDLLSLKETPIEDPNRTVLKNVISGKTKREAGALYFKAIHSIEVDKDYQKSSGFLDQAIRIDPNFLNAYLIAAVINLQKNEWGKAYEHIQKAIALDAQNIVARALFGLYYVQTGNVLKAKEESKFVYQNFEKFVPLAQNFINAGFDKKYFDNGKIEFKARFVNGRPNGPYKMYYPKGMIKEEGRYKAGVIDGKGNVYYQNGKKNIEFEFHNGRLIQFRHFDENGNLIENHQM